MCLALLDAEEAGQAGIFEFETESAYVMPALMKASRYHKRFNELLEHSELTLIEHVLAGEDAGNNGIDNERSNNIARDLQKYYKEPKASLLHYCYNNSDRKLGKGFYCMRSDSKSLCVFLHGDGGCFRYYFEILKQRIMDSDIVMPAYGINWDRTKVDYINDAIDYMVAKKGDKYERIHLMCISGSVDFGFNAFIERGASYDSFVGLVGHPKRPPIRVRESCPNPCFIAGIKDKRFPIAGFDASMQKNKAQIL